MCYVKMLIEIYVGWGIWVRYGDGVWKYLNVGIGEYMLLLLLIFMKVWVFDVYKIDCIGCVIVEGFKGF